MGICDWCSKGSNRSIWLGRSYDEIGFENPRSFLNKMRWKGLWLKLKREKSKLLDSSGSLYHVPCYDEESYLQNFDQGTGNDEPENFSRSFSVRFAAPSRDFPTKSRV